MCGIGGIMMRGGEAPSKTQLGMMSLALKHRGPDGEGQVVVNDVGLVHRRLSIIDLENGAQPLCDEKGNYLVGNAEIYNFRELGSAIPGTQLSTASDCEPPLHLYRRYDLAFTKQLRGMYALAIYDGSKGRLVLSRDPFGIKPLYFVERHDGFFFASELQALLEAEIAPRKLSEEAINQLLNRQFTPGKKTIFSTIQRVKPGETLVVEGGKIVHREKVDALPNTAIHNSSVGDLEAELDRELNESISFHQRSDVPYGLFFSGGVDSSCVLAAMAQQNDQPVVAYTAGFDSESVPDETIDARRIAESMGAIYSEVRISRDDFWNELPSIAAALDEPCADYAIIPSYILARHASKDVKVVLSGEGGDELFAGYGRYRRALRPRWLGGRSVAPLIFDKLKVLSSSMAPIEVEEFENSRFSTPLQRLQAIDFGNWLPNDLLLKLDRCLMAHGLEGRTPFLDRSLVDFAFRLPDKTKVRQGRGKWLLRQWLSKRWPDAGAFTRKRGFTVPVREWMETGGKRLGELVAAQPGVQEVCEPGSVVPIYCRGGKRLGQAAWTLLFFALWHRKHVLGLSPTGGDVYDCLSFSAQR